MAYYSFLERLKKNKSITVFNKGLMKRDFTFIDDVLHGIVLLSKVKLRIFIQLLILEKENQIILWT